MHVAQDQAVPSGIRGELVFLYPDDGSERTEEQRRQDTTERPFRICATLLKSPPLIEEIKGQITPKDGASYINGISSVVEIAEGRVQFAVNERGEVSFLETEHVADSIDNARRVFQRALLPIVDHLSYLADCPIFIGAVSLEDRTNRLKVIDYVAPYHQYDLPQNCEFAIEMKPVYALYREAKNSESSFYKFLCYYKILEGLLQKMRKELAREAQRRRVAIQFPNQVVPDHYTFSSGVRAFVGKPIRDFFNILTPIRHAAAHFLAGSGTVNTSEPDHLDKFANLVLICELSARALILDHEAALKKLREAP